jgi:GNAT superfamily N-acetyltransferase
MIELRTAESDDDLEAWRRVRIAVLPNERTATVEEMRRTTTPEALLLVAFVDGELAGSGIAGRSDLAGQGFVAPRVLPQSRRRGVGSRLLRALTLHVEAIGFGRAGSNADDLGALAFAERFGFREVGRQVEQVRTIGEMETAPLIPADVELISLAERPELRIRTYHELALQAFDDMPTPMPIQISLEDWEREWISWPEGSFVALAGDEIVGCAGLIRDDDRPDRAENSLTAVRRDWRGRGVARALKEQTIAWASANGLREIYTWTQTGNEGMRTVNEKLGYTTRDVSIDVRAELPLS